MTSKVGPDTAERVVDWFAKRDCATYHQLAAGLGLSLDHARVICCELTREGFLRRDGKIAAKTRPRTLWALA